MAKTERDFEILAETCRDIVASKRDVQFVVGITTNASVRRSHYRRWAAQHEAGEGKGTLNGFVILDWGYSQADIMRVERYLFEALREHPNYGVVDMNYEPIVHRKGVNADNQMIYLAWWSPYLVIADEYA